MRGLSDDKNDRGYDSLVPIFPDPNLNEIPSIVNYQFPKLTKTYD